MSRLKNSITPTRRPCGSAGQRQNGARRAAATAARGSCRRVTSGIQTARPLVQTRPGSPMPSANVREAEARGEFSEPARDLGHVPGADAAQGVASPIDLPEAPQCQPSVADRPSMRGAASSRVGVSQRERGLDSTWLLRCGVGRSPSLSTLVQVHHAQRLPGDPNPAVCSKIRPPGREKGSIGHRPAAASCSSTTTVACVTPISAPRQSRPPSTGQDGPEALERLGRPPSTSCCWTSAAGYEWPRGPGAARWRRRPSSSMMTADDTSDTLLKRCSGRASLPPKAVPAEARSLRWSTRRRGARGSLPIEVVSASRNGSSWSAPVHWNGDRSSRSSCTSRHRLPEDVRESVAQAFRELLTNAIEWGGISIRDARSASRACGEADAPLSHRRPRRRLRYRPLRHAAISNPDDDRAASSYGKNRGFAGRLRPGDDGRFVDDLIRNEARNELTSSATGTAEERRPERGDRSVGTRADRRTAHRRRYDSPADRIARSLEDGDTIPRDHRQRPGGRRTRQAGARHEGGPRLDSAGIGMLVGKFLTARRKVAASRSSTRRSAPIT